MLKAVIADDEPAVASILSHFIEREGLPISVIGNVTNGQEALELIRTLRPDLVFLDIQMPVYNGIEVMQMERNARYIIITAYESFQCAQEALRLGACDLLLKPIEAEQLTQAIARAVGWNFTRNDLTNQILMYLHENHAEPINLAALSELFHATPSHMAKTFKKHTGFAIVVYLNKLRIEKAKILLSDTSLTIQDVASSSGYETLNNFYKHFKQITGVPPAAFRNRSGIDS